MMWISEEDSLPNIRAFHSESCIGFHYTKSQEQASSCPTLPLLHSCYETKMKNNTRFDIYRKLHTLHVDTEIQQNKHDYQSNTSLFT